MNNINQTIATPTDDTLGLLSDLIAFDTTSRHSNLALIEYIEAYLAKFGIKSELSWNTEKTKANLFATLGEDSSPGIVLSGHTDVVPVDGQNWSTDPFKVEIKNNRLYGRGSCDMKGFIAICLAKTESILQAELPHPIHFAFSYDEEVGCVGVVNLLEQLKTRAVQPRACIIGEPTSMGVIRAHKGMLFKRCRVHGKSAHSSLVNQGVNAVTAAAKTIAYIDNVAERIKTEGPFDPQFEPPYTTLHCGVIHGGTANNIIPSECQFDFEIRNLPDQPTLPIFHEVEQFSRSLEPAMRAVDAEAGFDWQTLADYPGMNTDEDAKVIQLAQTLLGDQRSPGKVSYGTEGGHFQAAGIEAVVCGPGSIEQAHKPDEYVDLSELAKGEGFIDTLIRVLGNGEIN
ncbi:MAG: acetylornithine deacetylase [Acidiferrobacterales bacterium]|nr:acetylornithine deacetylase [Acidiferrobacterales bacterium]